MTWNVLHRVHAENYNEPTVTVWPDESARVKAIAALVLKAVTADACDLVLLQEVSGDVLAELRRRLPSTLKICSHQVPRHPTFKRPSQTVLLDASEHVVVIGPTSLTPVRAQTAVDDSGKGLLAVQVTEGLFAISTHVSWGEKGVGQLQVLQALLQTLTGTVIIGGDFNTERTTVSAQLGENLTVTELAADSPRTRSNPDGEGSDIDHLVCRGATWSDVHVVDHHGLSDHHPLLATLQLAV